MIATLNDVSAFNAPEKKPSLVSEDSCSRCLRQGYTYIFEDPISDPPFFKSFSADESLPTGQCCEVKDGEVDCITGQQAVRDILWETIAYKGLASGDTACVFVPEMKQLIQELIRIS